MASAVGASDKVWHRPILFEQRYYTYALEQCKVDYKPEDAYAITTLKAAARWALTMPLLWVLSFGAYFNGIVLIGKLALIAVDSVLPDLNAPPAEGAGMGDAIANSVKVSLLAPVKLICGDSKERARECGAHAFALAQGWFLGENCKLAAIASALAPGYSQDALDKTRQYVNDDLLASPEGAQAPVCDPQFGTNSFSSILGKHFHLETKLEDKKESCVQAVARFVAAFFLFASFHRMTAFYNALVGGLSFVAEKLNNRDIFSIRTQDARLYIAPLIMNLVLAKLFMISQAALIVVSAAYALSPERFSQGVSWVTTAANSLVRKATGAPPPKPVEIPPKGFLARVNGWFGGNKASATA